MTERFLELARPASRRRTRGSRTSPTSAPTRPTAPPRATTTSTTPTTAPAFRAPRRPRRGAGDAPAPRRHGAPSWSAAPPTSARPRQLRATYWGNMAEVDDQLGRLFDAPRRAPALADDTLVVLTSDHGDQMGDHWLVEKLGWWDESYHVPLIVVDPRPEADATRGTVVDALHRVRRRDAHALHAGSAPRSRCQCDGRALQPFARTATSVPHDWRTEAHWQWDFRDPVGHLRRGPARPHHGAVHDSTCPRRGPQVRALRQRRAASTSTSPTTPTRS